MKKITVYKIILVILVITAIILAGFVIKKQIESKKVEDNTKTVLQEIKKENKSNPEQIDVIQEIDQKIGEYKVIAKFWGEKINQKGNVVLAGHNRLNNTMFGKIDKLENGDIIELTDSQMVTVKYQVFDKYVIDPNDIDCIFPIEENTREVTLITCTNRDKNRLVVKAREVI